MFFCTRAVPRPQSCWNRIATVVNKNRKTFLLFYPDHSNVIDFCKHKKNIWSIEFFSSRSCCMFSCTRAVTRPQSCWNQIATVVNKNRETFLLFYPDHSNVINLCKHKKNIWSIKFFLSCSCSMFFFARAVIWP